MNNLKNNIGIIVGIAGFVFFIAAVTIVFTPSKNSAQNGQASSVTDTTDMASHHTGVDVPADSTVFNALVGKPVPNFSLKDRDGNEYTPESLRGKNVVIFFNEGLMCYPSCWNQIVSLAQDTRLKENNAVAVSIVIDAPKDWQRAVGMMPALGDATVVFDQGSAVSKQFGVLTLNSSMHKGIFPGHTYLVLDTEGTVRYVLDDPSMAINNDKIVEELKKL